MLLDANGQPFQNNDFNLFCTVFDVSNKLSAVPFLTADNRFKILKTNDSPEATANALSELRLAGAIRSFQQVFIGGGTCFAVEYH